eukprot:GDKI01035437.1.p2 GENE.GDKI01035437.1~~GDKI01035437.1.p2  ORF type:complete len:110 (-),score=32.91 GDKI01035437.1:911-1240(-)
MWCVFLLLFVFLFVCVSACVPMCVFVCVGECVCVTDDCRMKLFAIILPTPHISLCVRVWSGMVCCFIIYSSTPLGVCGVCKCAQANGCVFPLHLSTFTFRSLLTRAICI